MRHLLALLLFAAPHAHAQSRFALQAETLLAGETRYALSGTPLAAERFDGLRLSVPGVGDFLVLDRPFGGARQAGAFEAGGLFFVYDGVPVRVRTAVPALPGSPERPAFVALAGPAPRDRSLLARAALATIMPAGEPTTRDAPLIVRPPASPPAPLDEGRLAALTAERDRLLARLTEVQDELVTLLVGTPDPGRDPAPTAPSFDVPDPRRLLDESGAARALAVLNRQARVATPYQTDVLLVTMPDGRVETAAVLRRQDARVDALVETFARALRFAPSIVDGMPAVVRTQVRVRLVPEP